MKNTDNIISQGAAAEIAGVKRQAISKLKKAGTRSFFTEAGKIDTNHPDWKSYLRNRESGERRAVARSEIRNSENDLNDFQFQDFAPETIQEEKVYSDIVQRKIAIMESLDLLIEKRLVVFMLGEIANAIQSNFVDHGRRTAPVIAAKLGLPGTEKTIEKIENAAQKRNIENLIAVVQKNLAKL